MPRNGGSTVDLAGRWIRDRNGIVYPLERLERAGQCLYHARPIVGNDHFSYHERWIISQQSWVINRFKWHKDRTLRMDWYMETELIEAGDDQWRVRDGYVDVRVFDGSRYEIEDVHELAEAMGAGDIPRDEALQTLTAFQRLVDTLRECGFRGDRLLERYAPGLPR